MHVGRREYHAERKDAPTLLPKEEFVEDTGQRKNGMNAAVRDAPTLLFKEECVSDTGQ